MYVRVQADWGCPVADTCTGRLPQILAQDYSLPEAVEAAVAWYLGALESTSRFLCLFHPAATQQPRAPASSKRNMGVPDMFFLEPGAVQLRSGLGVAYTHTTMPGVRNQAPDSACGQGSHSGHVEPARSWSATEGCEERSTCSYYEQWRNIVVSKVYLPKPSFSTQL